MYCAVDVLNQVCHQYVVQCWWTNDDNVFGIQNNLLNPDLNNEINNSITLYFLIILVLHSLLVKKKDKRFLFFWRKY